MRQETGPIDHTGLNVGSTMNHLNLTNLSTQGLNLLIIRIVPFTGYAQNAETTAVVTFNLPIACVQVSCGHFCDHEDSGNAVR